MKHLNRTMTPTRLGFLILTLFLGPAEAVAGEDDPSPPSVPPTDVPRNAPQDWSQTRLNMKPPVEEQIERTKSFLDNQASGMADDIARLNSEGHLNRRSTSRIRNALDNALGTMTGMTDAMQGQGAIDGWTARMIAYELGMAADTLTQQADEIEIELTQPPERESESQEDQPSKLEHQTHLAQTLRSTSRLLRETARAIVRNLE